MTSGQSSRLHIWNKCSSGLKGACQRKSNNGEIGGWESVALMPKCMLRPFAHHLQASLTSLKWLIKGICCGLVHNRTSGPKRAQLHQCLMSIMTDYTCRLAGRLTLTYLSVDQGGSSILAAIGMAEDSETT